MTDDVDVAPGDPPDRDLQPAISLDPDPSAPPRIFLNPFYRFMTTAGAGMVAVLGLAGAVISRSVQPPMPMAVTVTDLVVTVVLFVWYVLGLRCRLEVGPDKVTVVSKVRRFEIPRDQIESASLDTSLLGILQPAGRSLRLTTVDGSDHRVIGALPSETQACAQTVAELQGMLGSPDQVTESKLDRIIQDRFGAGPAVEHVATDKEWVLADAPADAPVDGDVAGAIDADEPHEGGEQ